MSKFLLGDIKLPCRRGEGSHQWEEEATKRKVAKVARDPLPLESVVAVALLGVSPRNCLGFGIGSEPDAYLQREWQVQYEIRLVPASVSNFRAPRGLLPSPLATLDRFKTSMLPRKSVWSETPLPANPLAATAWLYRPPG